MPLPRLAWIVTVGICLVAAAAVFANGYEGYTFVLLAIAAAAAVNLR